MRSLVGTGIQLERPEGLPLQGACVDHPPAVTSCRAASALRPATPLRWAAAERDWGTLGQGAPTTGSRAGCADDEVHRDGVSAEPPRIPSEARSDQVLTVDVPDGSYLRCVDDDLLTTEEVKAEYRFADSAAARDFIRSAGGFRVGRRLLVRRSRLVELERRLADRCILEAAARDADARSRSRSGQAVGAAAPSPPKSEAGNLPNPSTDPDWWQKAVA